MDLKASSRKPPPARADDASEGAAWRKRLHEIIFEAHTPAGKTFDVILLILIILSILAVVLDSVQSLRQDYGALLFSAEWIFTILFSIEYLLRLSCVKHPTLYARSFFGVIDLVSILPTYLSLLFVDSNVEMLLVLRALRLLRVFRVLKLARYSGEARVLTSALHASRVKITVFLVTVLTLVLIIGAVMYLVEGPAHGFHNIPISMYWAIVTMTTVGYGDIAPQTDLGRFIAALVMILGYGIIAVPTGIVSVELAQATLRRGGNPEACPGCGSEGHDEDAAFCKYCGTKL